MVKKVFQISRKLLKNCLLQDVNFDNCVFNQVLFLTCQILFFKIKETDHAHYSYVSDYF